MGKKRGGKRWGIGQGESEEREKGHINTDVSTESSWTVFVVRYKLSSPRNRLMMNRMLRGAQAARTVSVC